MKAYKKRNTYIRGFCNLLITVLFIAVLLAIVFGIFVLIYCILQKIPNLNTIYGSLISASVTIILTFISYIAKLKKYLPILLHKIKQKIYHFLSGKYVPFSELTITDFNEINMSETNEQGKFISSAIHILKNNAQDMILISGYSGSGKTTSIMLLLNAIAHDKELYWVFSELQNRIVYFDSVNDKDALLNYLSHTEKQKCKLIIVDNIQKYTISSISEVMGRVNNLTLHNQNASKKVLIVLLYQETGRNGALYDYVKHNFFKVNDNIFKINQYVNLETKVPSEYYSSPDEVLKTHIQRIEDSFFRQHVKNILYNRKDDSIIILLNDLVFANPAQIPSDREKYLFVLMAVIFIGLYNG